MAKHLICPDVSEFQVPLDGTYTRDFIIFRVMFGAHYLDPKFLHNAAVAKKLYNDGRIAGVLLYVVYTADSVKAQFDATWDAIGPRIPNWLTGIMIDVETWRGKDYALAGDHSKRINRLYGLHAHRMDNWNSVIAYGNTGDLDELYPHRDHRCRVIVASYGSQLSYRRIRGAIGQQYSNGRAVNPVPRLAGRKLPRRSEPFGHCDHNVFPGISTGRELVRMLRPEQLDPHADPGPEGVAIRPKTARPKTARPKTARPKTVRPKTARPKTARPKKKPAEVVLPAADGSPGPRKAVITKKPPSATVVVTARHDVARNAITSANGSHTLVVRNDGSLELRHRITPNAISPGER